MPIDTNNEKLALIVFCRTTDPLNTPMLPGALGQDDKQQLLWGYPGILWATGVAAVKDIISMGLIPWSR